MPLRLKSLELQGYKSFASRTAFEFAEGLTAIVGPNGSGKSNIADALRWVLGEQSYLLLRGKKTEDMIFNGSESRPRAGMASVSIVFDNSEGWLPVDFSEVAVSRRAYRDGRNDYLLNGHHVRLRDLNELLAESGLAERTYTILGQGMVDASLALRSEDRRRLFEEAAGIGLYRGRREEALKRLETTGRNLERVLDILSELEPRLKSLERQARRAKEYRQVQHDLKSILREWYGYHWQRAGRELSEARVTALLHESQVAQERAAFQGIVSKMAETRQGLSEQRVQLHEWNRQAAEVRGEREAVSRELAVLEERRRAMAENRAQVESEAERLSGARQDRDADVAMAESEAARLRAELEEARSHEQQARLTLAARRTERTQGEESLQDARERVSELASRRAQVAARLDELAARIERDENRLRSGAAVLVGVASAARAADGDLTAAGTARVEAESVEREAEGSLKKARETLEWLEAERRNRLDQRSAVTAEHARQKARWQVLEQAEQSLAGLAEGARALLDAARERHLTGAQGALSAGLEVPPELEAALAAALGDQLDAILLEGEQSVEQALALLEHDSTGRAALLPLGWLDPAPPITAPPDEDCLGVASTMVGAPEVARPAIDALLGRTLIVRDRRSARRLLKHSRAQRVVTLGGEVFRADGLVMAGRDPRSARLGRPREKMELEGSMAGLEAELVEVDRSLQAVSEALMEARNQHALAESRLADARQDLIRAGERENATALRAESIQAEAQRQQAGRQSLESEISQTQTEQSQLRNDLERIEAELAETQDFLRRAGGELAGIDLQEATEQVTFWSTRAEVSERVLAEARRRLDERCQAKARLEEEILELGRRAGELGDLLEGLATVQISRAGKEAELARALTDLRERIEPVEHGLEAAERSEASLAAEEAAQQRSLQAAERQNSQAQLDLARKQEALEALQRRIEDDFGLVQFDYEPSVEGAVPLPLGELVETLPQVAELAPELGENLAQKKAQLRRMGAINIEAHQEYEETLERFNTMSAQIEDLREAAADLREVVAELDQQTRVALTRTFEAVAAHFKEIFVRLFGGGSARLVLTDPDNLSETGIDIEARLPGKREQGLALLSGGERSLTAIALVFALLRVAPTPLCVLDEVDAMLDEANVGRFADLLQELSERTQFIIITHNRSTVQVADVIYGVTMGRDSVSQVISLKLDEVGEEMLEA
jgi:chromosome segregation protein